ncbi:hybrid sensor histidine kinase/response regulator [Caballeronia sp. LjRoot34]|uniref:hybrid sensor histidine kinase/response regulator n=1 Tax=Caballeronia sp. LjRoot34 TaxID=3342325 RepID=UPI003ECE2561
MRVSHLAVGCATRLRIGLWFLTIVLTGFLLGSVSAQASSQDDGLDLATVSSHLRLTRQLSLLEDKTGQLEVTSALTGAGWHLASPRTLQRGFTASAFWLKGTLYNSSNQPVTRWLSVGVERLEDVRYFSFAPGDRLPREMLLSGNREPLGLRPIRAALPVFPVTLAPGERISFALRIQSRSTINMDVDVWNPRTFRQVEERDSMIEMLLAGSMLTVTLYTLILGAIRRDRVFLLLGCAVVAEVFYSLAFHGFLYRYVLTGGGEWVLRSPTLFSSVAAASFSAMAVAFMGLERVSYWRWIYRALIGALIAATLWTAVGDYRASANVAIDLVILCNVVWAASALDGWRRGFANARLFLLSFAPDCVTLFLRIAVILGAFPQRWVAGTEMAWDNLSVLLMMVLIIAGRTTQSHRAQRQAQQDLLDAREREQERLEQAVNERTHELQDARIAADEANGAKTDFLARVSHDLRTPLTSIIGFADLVQAAGREDAERGRIIRRSANHMLTMVNDLIDYAGGSNPDALRPEPVYLHGLLDSIAQEGASLADKRGNRFVLDIRGELPPILELDNKRILQVLGNLIDNATKFTQNGTITLSVDCQAGTPNAPVTLLFVVADTGCGIAPEDKERIFEPFLRLDAARHVPGIGLGLAIVRQWILRMGGALEVDSVLGVGTTVRVSLTARPVDEAEITRHYVSDAIGVLPLIDGSGLRIWIAEDTAEIRQFLTDELSSLGFIVEALSDGRAIIERIIESDGPPPDLILTDHMMPGADGTAVLAATRRCLPTVPVVAVSATPQAVRARRDEGGLGYDACLLKPVNLAELRNTLARLLQLTRAPSVDDTLNDEPLIRPSTQTLAETKLLIELGAISDIIDWAEKLATDDPQCEVFALKVRHLARLGDLAELQSLCRAP